MPDKRPTAKPEPTSALDGSPLPPRWVRRGRRWTQQYRSGDWTIKVVATEDEDPSEFSHYEFRLIRSTPELAARLRAGRGLTKKDEWEFIFDGPGLVTTITKIRMLAAAALFAQDLDEQARNQDRWIALHYVARTSQALTRSARCDQEKPKPLEKPKPPKSLNGMTDKQAAEVLAGDLKIDSPEVLRAIHRFTKFWADLVERPPREGLLSALPRKLGLKAYEPTRPGPGLSEQETAELETLRRAFNDRRGVVPGECKLDLQAQDRLLELLDRRIQQLRPRKPPR